MPELYEATEGNTADLLAVPPPEPHQELSVTREVLAEAKGAQSMDVVPIVASSSRKERGVHAVSADHAGALAAREAARVVPSTPALEELAEEPLADMAPTAEPPAETDHESASPAPADAELQPEAGAGSDTPVDPPQGASCQRYGRSRRRARAGPGARGGTEAKRADSEDR